MYFSDHIYELMVEWGNLYQYCQLDLEASNLLIKHFFDSRGSKSQLVPVARLFHKRILCMPGLAKIFLGSKASKKEAQKASAKKHKQTNEDNDIDIEEELQDLVLSV